MKLDYSLSSCMKLNSKCIKDLNIRPETINYIEEKIATNFMDLGLKEDFTNLISIQTK